MRSFTKADGGGGTIILNKSQIRSQMHLIREQFHRSCNQRECSKTVIQNLLPLLQPTDVIAGYYPKDHELDLLPVLEFLHTHGWKLCLPSVITHSQELQFKQWQPGDELMPGPFNTLQPDFNKSEVIPDVLLIPLMAVDKAGNRIGYGRGYYDVTINYLKQIKQVLLVGVCYDIQIIDNVPQEPTDAALDYIITQKGRYKCQI